MFMPFLTVDETSGSFWLSASCGGHNHGLFSEPRSGEIPIATGFNRWIALCACRAPEARQNFVGEVCRRYAAIPFEHVNHRLKPVATGISPPRGYAATRL